MKHRILLQFSFINSGLIKRRRITRRFNMMRNNFLRKLRLNTLFFSQMAHMSSDAK